MRTRGRGLSFEAGACLAILALGAGGAIALAQPAPDLTLQPDIGSLIYPLGFVNAGDGSGRNFVVTQFGKIFVYQGNTGLGTFLDVSALLPCGDPSKGGCGEQGLLGLAFHPNYATNGLFFIDYTNTDGNEVIARYKVSADAGRRRPGERDDPSRRSRPVPQPQRRPAPVRARRLPLHRDGRRRRPAATRAIARRTTGVLLGKILRIDVDGSERCRAARRRRGLPTHPTGFPPTTRSSERTAPARRSGRTACAIRGASASTA